MQNGNSSSTGSLVVTVLSRGAGGPVGASELAAHRWRRRRRPGRHLRAQRRDRAAALPACAQEELRAGSPDHWLKAWSHPGRINPESPGVMGESPGLLSRGSQVRVLPGALDSCLQNGLHRLADDHELVQERVVQPGRVGTGRSLVGARKCERIATIASLMSRSRSDSPRLTAAPPPTGPRRGCAP